MESSQVLVNRTTEKTVDSQHSIKEKIEQIERTYLAGSDKPTDIRHHVIKEDDEPRVISSFTQEYKMSTANDNNNKKEEHLQENNTKNSEQDQLNGSDDKNAVKVPDNAHLISRTTQQVKTQQVKTITKVYTTREVRHIGPDGQPIESNESVPATTAPVSTFNSAPDAIENNLEKNSINEYSNFPGPKINDYNNTVSCSINDQTNINNYNNFDPHYSNANFQKILQQQMAPSPSSGSTGTTGSTAAASFVNTANPRIYDPYARNNQIGYQDYSNFNNYQDLPQQMNDTITNGQNTQNASPQPPMRRHHLTEIPPGNDISYDQASIPPVYGYVPTSSGLQIPMNSVPPGMHSPGATAVAAAAIYGNLEDAPQGYLDRRQTYDENTMPAAAVTYGQMLGPSRRNMPIPSAMYEDAESAYQHLHALQQAAIMEPQQAAMFISNGTVLPAGTRMVPISSGAPGSAAVTAIGPDGVRWRDPDLHEVIEFLTHSNTIVRANAAAYLQHLCFMDDSMKAKTRALGGIPTLINLLAQDVPEIQRNACGALRNLSYGRQNDENKRAIRMAGGIPALVRLLRKTHDNEIRELVTSVMWNLSSCEDLKKQIIDDALQVLVSTVIIPHSGWDKNNQQPQQQQPPTQQPIYWSTVFRNASGVLRNVSSAGEYARCRLRECEGLVDSLLFLVRAAIGKNDMDNKSVENCVCILRNLSYRCQEVVDPEYDKHPPGVSSPNTSTNSTHHANTSSVASPSSTLSPSSSSSSKNSSSSLMSGLSSKVGENISCFGGSKKKSKNHNDAMSPSMSVSGLESKTGNLSLNSPQRMDKGMELLWQTDVVQPYLALLSECSNPETLEAAAGAIQNLAACYWQPSIDIRGAVRKEKGLPILVELLRMEVDRVVCAVATALRNLAMDTRNKELIGKYALKDLVSKLPAPSATGVPLETGTSDDTVSAVLATLNEVIARNPDFAKSMLEAGGMPRLTLVTKHRNRFSNRVVKFTSQLLYNMWQHTELRDVYRKAGWKESHFIISHSANANSARAAVSGSGNRTLNGPSNSMGIMTPSQSAIIIPSTPTVNGTLPGSGFYHSISANNTLSRPMSTVGGTKYEDHGQYRATLPTRSTVANQQQLMNQRMHDEMLMNDIIDAPTANLANGTTLVRPPAGAVPIFPSGPVPLLGEPVYAQVNRERKRQQQQHQQQQASPVTGTELINANNQNNNPANTNNNNNNNNNNSNSNSAANANGTSTSNVNQYHNVMIDPTSNEPIYPPSMPAGDSWV